MAATTAIVAAAGYSAYSANKASKQQANAAEDAAQATQDAQAQLRQDLSPYVQLGEDAINPLLQAMGYRRDASGKISIVPGAQLQQKFAFNPSNLAQTPGYQFTLGQGLKAAQNSAAARGLGLSGAQLKGAENYATGLAQNTYNDQYNNALSAFNTNYNVASNNVSNLQNLLNVGQNSAAQVGNAGLTSANTAGNYLTSGANAQAAGQIGMSNALTGGLSNYLTYNKLFGG